MFDKQMMSALEDDAAKLRQLTGEDHGPVFLWDCPQCGEGTDQLHEGYCQECCADNQRALDEHNEAHDRWQAMSQEQRDAAIKRAIR
jgi:hypothetical protein